MIVAVLAQIGGKPDALGHLADRPHQRLILHAGGMHEQRQHPVCDWREAAFPLRQLHEGVPPLRLVGLIRSRARVQQCQPLHSPRRLPGTISCAT